MTDIRKKEDSKRYSTLTVIKTSLSWCVYQIS